MRTDLQSLLDSITEPLALLERAGSLRDLAEAVRPSLSQLFPEFEYAIFFIDHLADNRGRQTPLVFHSQRPQLDASHRVELKRLRLPNTPLVKTTQGARSSLFTGYPQTVYIPLSYNHQRGNHREDLGLLAVGTRHQRIFEPRELAALDTLGTQLCLIFSAFFRTLERHFFRLAKDVSPERGIRSYLECLLQRLIHVIPAAGSSLFLYDIDKRILFLEATTGLYSRPPHSPRIYHLGEGLTGWVAEHRKNLRIYDIADTEELHRIAEDLTWKSKFSELPQATEASFQDWQSFLAVPLLDDEDPTQLLGVLRLSKRVTGQAFLPQDEALATEVSRFFSKRLRTLRDQRRAQDFRFLRDLGATLSSGPPDLETMANEFVQRLLSISDCDECEIFFTEDLPAPLGGSRSSVRFDRATEGSSGGGWRATATIPITAHGRKLGVVELRDSRPEALLGENRRTAEEFIEGTALFFDYGIRYGELTTRLGSVVHVLESFGATLDMQSIFDSFIEEALSLSGAHCAAIVTLDGDNKNLTVECHWNYNNIEGIALEANTGISGACIAEGRVVKWVRGENNQISAIVADDRITFELAFPITYRQIRLGCICLAWTSGGERRLREEVRQTLNLLTQHVGFALSFHRLLSEREQIRLQREKLDSVVGLGSLAASIAHDFNNRLGSLQSRLKRIQPIISRCDPSNEDLREAGKVLDSLYDLTNTLKTRQTNRAVEFEDVYINEVVQNSINVLESYAAANRVALTADFDSTLSRPKRGQGHPIRANFKRLDRAIENFIKNAIEASSPRTVVRISTQRLPASSKREPDRQQIIIQDYGVGMSAEQESKVFEPGYTTKATGTGFGMANAQATIASIGGRIHLQTREGRGTTFTIELPVVETRG